MNNPKPIILGLLILIVEIVSITGVANYQTQTEQQASQEQKQAETPEKAKGISDALRRGGYREAARLYGHVITQEDPAWDWAAFDLETLTQTSAVVIVGEPGDGTGCLTPEGTLITTNYAVIVTESLKGNFRVGNSIQVSMMGGRVDFEDGTSAEVQTPGFEKMVKGRKYLLFLTENGNGSPILILTGGPQGLFEIGGPQVKPFGRTTDKLTKQAINRDSEDLLKEIRSYTMK